MPKRTRLLGDDHTIQEGFDLRLFGTARMESQMSDPAEYFARDIRGTANHTMQPQQKSTCCDLCVFR